MKRKIRKELSVGILCFAVSLILKRFTVTPEFIIGGLMGVSICFEIIGALPDKAYNALKKQKKALFQRS